MPNYWLKVKPRIVKESQLAVPSLDKNALNKNASIFAYQTILA